MERGRKINKEENKSIAYCIGIILMPLCDFFLFVHFDLNYPYISFILMK